MKIKNLGPIKELKLSLDQLNLFGSIHVNNRDNQPYVEVIWYRDRGDRSQCNLSEIIAKVVKINKFEKLDSA